MADEDAESVLAAAANGEAEVIIAGVTVHLHHRYTAQLVQGIGVDA